MIIAQTIIDRVASLLGDPHNGDPLAGTWPDALLLDYLNAAMRTIVLTDPSANPVWRKVTLTAGYRTEMEKDVLAIMGAAVNFGTNNTAGDTALISDLGLIHAVNRSWTAELNWSDGPVENFALTPAAPRDLWVYPARKAAGWVLEVQVCVIPSDVRANEGITLNDSYEPAIREYMQYLALISDSNVSNIQKAKAHEQSFYAMFKGQEVAANGFNQTPPNAPIGGGYGNRKH